MGTKARRAALTLAGVTLAGGAMVGMASPATAASPATGAPAGHAATTHSNWGGWGDSNYDFRGFYNNRWRCEQAGQWQTRWSGDDYVCVRSRSWQQGWGGGWRGQWNSWGHQSGVWALYVEG